MKTNINVLNSIDIINKKIKDDKNRLEIFQKNYLYRLDINKYYHLIKLDLNLLNKINSSFLKFFCSDISMFLNLENIKITLSNTIIQTYSKYISQFKRPISVNLIELNSNKDIFLIIFSDNFLSMIIDNLFGGSELKKITNNYRHVGVTPYERRIIKKIVKILLLGYQKAYQETFPVNMKYIQSHVESDFHKLSFANHMFIITSFDITIGYFKSTFNILLPIFTINELKKLPYYIDINKSKIYKDKEKNDLFNNVNYIYLTLIAKLTKICLPLNKVLNLKIGDVLPINKPNHGIVYVDTVPIFLGECTIVDNKYACCIRSVVKLTRK
ncbi:FliM/FliN family flagellar motor switch protein [Buchnera aphidicola (Formosaphis micheliae)]|uniref:FliM/FliN family flagellar motor switch protein n=1 Tax=Buchnera aphidicola TaxID=9 RepID=UPI0031B88D89